jgi:redox-sensitive bicupin YhaK (pirin superfamily)
LNTYHTFSFANYYDPRYIGFRSLLVINEDRVAKGEGFGTHGHRDMEIITYVLDGALEHRDSMGTSSVIRPGEVQRMSAGTGVTHSEYNHSKSDLVHFLQIWIRPDRIGVAPGYDQKAFPIEERKGQLRLIVSHDGRDGSIAINQDTDLYTTTLDAGQKVAHELAAERYGWVQVARGAVSLNGIELAAGDGAAVGGENRIEIDAREDSEILLFDLV